MKAEIVIVKSNNPEYYYSIRFLTKNLDEKHEIEVLKSPNNGDLTRKEISKKTGHFVLSKDAHKAKNTIWKALRSK